MTVRHVLTGGLGLVLIAGVVLFLNPERVGAAMTHFRLVLIVPILALSLLVYLLQGVRWHFLLRDAGTKLRLRDTILVNMAGQTITAILPLGDLTQKPPSRVPRVGQTLCTVAATVTFQELTVHPGPHSLGAADGADGWGWWPDSGSRRDRIGIAAIIVILTVSPVFCRIHSLVAHIPFLSKLLPVIDELQGGGDR